MFCYREFLHPDLNHGLFFTRQFFYIQLNKEEKEMERIVLDIDDLIFCDEEAYVSDR